MIPRSGRGLVLLVSAAVVVLLTAGYLASQVLSGPAAEPPATLGPAALEAPLYVRSTRDDQYSQVTSVDEVVGGDAATTPTSRSCDRIDVLPDRTMVCMKAQMSVLQRTRLTVVRPDGGVVDSWQVPGVPSRVRFSPDGSLVASTTFVAGHSYLQAGFSTATQVREVGGDADDLEDYALELEGEQVTPVDRKYWGVTFVDDRTFYATVRTGGQTWLVQGDRDRRTLTSLRSDAECPSLSPDGRHLVYKKRQGYAGADWTLAVLDLRTGEERLLGERRSVDDQVEWLDRDTILYAILLEDAPGHSDVWALDVAAGSEPQLVVEEASSPSVVPPSVVPPSVVPPSRG